MEWKMFLTFIIKLLCSQKSGRRILNKIPCPAWKSQEAGARIDSKSNVATSTNSDVIKGFEEFISVAAMSEDPLNWRRDCSVLLQPDGVCFYRLSSDMTSLNVSFSFRVIVSKEMRVAVFHRELEVECTKLESWSQFRHLMDSCHSQPDVKVNTNPYHHIKRAQNCLLEINSSPEIDEVIEPIAQQLETAAGMFDPFTGEFSAVAQVSVKEEPAYFNKYDVETPAARFDPFNGEFSGVGQVSIKEEPMSIADDEEIFKPAAELKKEHSEYEIYQPLPFSPTVREEVKVKKPRKKYTRVKERKQTDPNQVFTCERCGLVFKDKAKLRDHCYNYHVSRSHGRIESFDKLGFSDGSVLLRPVRQDSAVTEAPSLPHDDEPPGNRSVRHLPLLRRADAEPPATYSRAT